MDKKEYQELIQSFAAEIFENYIKEYRQENPDADFNACESALRLHDVIHEYIGGSEYTFKWFKALDVLKASDRLSKHISRSPRTLPSCSRVFEDLAYRCMYDDLYEGLQVVVLDAEEDR